jgi:Peptidase A4 family
MKNRRVVNRPLLLEELEGRLAPSASSLGYSTNWSGYAVTAGNGSVSAVSASWNVPTILQGRGTAYSAEWVGIDGFSSATVEQIGTEADLINGAPQYYAWFEMYPLPYVTIPLTIHAGDSISAGVSHTTGNNFALTITDNSTTGVPYTTTQSLGGVASALQSSAEWIVEAPSSGRVLPLADVGTVKFTGAQATISGNTGAIDTVPGATSVNQIDMITNRGALLDSTSALNDSGPTAPSTFTVTSTQQSSSTPPHHEKGSPVRSPDQVVVLLPNALAGSATNIVASPPTGITQVVASPSSFAANSTNIGFGTRRFEFYLPGDTTDRPDDIGDDGTIQAPTTPAAPAKPVNNLVPPQAGGHIAGTDQAHWLAAVDAVFAQDFPPPEVMIPAQADRLDSKDSENSQNVQQLQATDRSLASGLLVLAGAGLLLGVRPRATKYPWAIEDDNKKVRVML